jgi:hypothetical protein
LAEAPLLVALHAYKTNFALSGDALLADNVAKADDLAAAYTCVHCAAHVFLAIPFGFLFLCLI